MSNKYKSPIEKIGDEKFRSDDKLFNRIKRFIKLIIKKIF